MNTKITKKASIDEAIILLKKISSEGYGDYTLRIVVDSISSDECYAIDPTFKMATIGAYWQA